MEKWDIIVAVTTLVTQSENGYHLSEEDKARAKEAIEHLERMLNK